MNQNLISYYNNRAKEYDKVYQIPEEQEDLAKATVLFQTIFANKTLLEIACGTGYWTEQIAKMATSIHAIDINRNVIDIAKTRKYNNNVTFEIADLFHIKTKNKFDAIFGGFIWSHILLQDLDNLLAKLKNQLTKTGTMVFIDSKPIEGHYHDKKRITRTDEFGNTFQTRQLEDGSTYEVLKNFPNNDFLYSKLSKIATNINLIDLEHYWIAISNKQ